ncbi:MAG TPA: tRNA lysidine(34) synthetase TilS, partial [Candidatus Avibacteroides faecavium]|nr:tRNA lysidine(34) synthetase TilS [Candidatus Avibacteroides faecavium]
SHDDDETVLADGDTTPFALGTLAVARCTATEALAEAKKSKTTAYLDARAVKRTLRVRRWRHGDWFIPFGMRGRKNISDLLTDLHKDLTAKDETYVVTDGGNIAWVVGERTDNRYRVTRDTEEAIKITYTPNQINHIK